MTKRILTLLLSLWAVAGFGQTPTNVNSFPLPGYVVPFGTFLSNNLQNVIVWSKNGNVAAYPHITNWAAAQQIGDFVWLNATTFNINSNSFDVNGNFITLTNGVTMWGSGGRTKATQIVLAGGNNNAILELFESNVLHGVSIVNSNACGFVFPIHIDAKSFVVDDVRVEGETDVFGYPTLGQQGTSQTGTVQNCYLQTQWDCQNAHPGSSRIDYFNDEFAMYRFWTNHCDGVTSASGVQFVRGGSNTVARFFSCNFNIYPNTNGVQVVLTSNINSSGTNEFHNCLFNVPSSAFVVKKTLSGIIPLMDNCIFPTNQMSGSAPQYFYGNTNNLADVITGTTIPAINATVANHLTITTGSISVTNAWVTSNMNSIATSVAITNYGGNGTTFRTTVKLTTVAGSTNQAYLVEMNSAGATNRVSGGAGFAVQGALDSTTNFWFQLEETMNHLDSIVYSNFHGNAGDSFAILTNSTTLIGPAN